MSTLIRRTTANLRRNPPLTACNSDSLRTRHHRFHTSVAPQNKDTGLYGFDHLKTPKGFQRFVDEAIERQFVEEANKAAMRINEYLHVSILTPIILYIMR
ncbi:hypothetical protein L1049_019317 [Liquidambar formosana]|uniref:Uncharacterized protein n=1 Tax=Liquidambar formosana TaxID=63359 RepID=A0AAP0X573_LIQFO